MKRSRLINLIALSAGQFLLITISVSIAAWVENVREDRKERQLSKVLLTQMLSELRLDEKELSADIPNLKSRISAADKMVVVLTTSHPGDSIKQLVADLNYYSSFTYNKATYETLKSIGFNVIENDSLRQEIVKFYESRGNNAFSRAHVSYDQTFNYYVPLLHEYFKEFSMSGGAIPVNLEALRQNNKVIEFFRIWRELMAVELEVLSDADTNTNILIANIQRELANL